MKEKMILAILMIKGMGRKTARKFIHDNDLSITAEELIDKLQVFSKTNKRVRVPSIDEFKNMLDEATDIINKQEKEGIVAISENSMYYPKKLISTDDAPLLLFAKGNLNLLNCDTSVAVIGTREITERGKKVAKRFGQVLAENNIIVVSGLAIGCDTYGHLGCLEVKGKTIAVLPSPIDAVYPSSNSELADNILDNEGLLLSEYYNGQSIRASYFVDRDRLQAGLSDCVIVVETDVEGGTMHTVGYTIKYGRKLACFYDEQNYIGLSQMNGNKKLVKEGVAYALCTKEDLDNLISDVCNASYEKERKESEEQMTLF